MNNPFPAKTLEDLQWSEILSALAQRAKTDLGKQRCRTRPFLASAAEVREELARVEELRALAVEERLALPLWGVRDVQPLLDRASKGGTLEPAE
ncbi:MAG: endonuclease MutS2, partial [Deltaproteobacteria bacterium]|nr:endonuclease MutS2 [Deltaproteobacteria bacterium]